MRDINQIKEWLNCDNDYNPCAKLVKGVIYIAGPMRGYENLNFLAFDVKEQELQEEGWIVHNPANTPMGLKSPKAYIMIDIAMIAESDAIYMLKGWEKSKGAKLEHSFAEFLGIKIYYEGSYEN